MDKGFAWVDPYHGRSVTPDMDLNGQVEMTGQHGRVRYHFRKTVGNIRVYALSGTSDAALADAIRSLGER